MKIINHSKNTRDRANNPPISDICPICKGYFNRPDTKWFFCKECRSLGNYNKKPTNNIKEQNKRFWDKIKQTKLTEKIN